MTDTTTRLLRLWERFPETRPMITFSMASRQWIGDRGLLSQSDAHAIAGWRLLEVLWAKRVVKLCEPWGDNYRVRIGQDNFDGASGLDALISAYWQAKGEQEPSE